METKKVEFASKLKELLLSRPLMVPLESRAPGVSQISRATISSNRSAVLYLTDINVTHVQEQTQAAEFTRRFKLRGD